MASGAESPPSPPSRGAPIVSSAEEKQRQPKTPPEEPKTKSKPPASTPDESSSSNDSDSDNNNVGFWASCLGDCITGCAEGTFEALFVSLFQHDKKPVAALTDSTSAYAADSSVAMAPYVPYDWAKLDVGYLHAYTPGDSVVLRRSASNPDSMMFEAGTLPDGARVLVIDTHEGASGTMLQVRAVDEQGPVGWVHAKSVRQEPDAPQQDEFLAADSLGKAAPAAPAARPPRWSLASTIGFTQIDNPLLATEYENGGPVFELEYLRWFGSSPVAGLGVGFRDLTGYPKVEYAGPTQVDVPNASAFEMPYAMLEFGQHLAWSSPFRLGYMVGPVVARVHEEAELDVLDAGTRQPIGTRHEVLNRWTWGGGGILSLGWATSAPHEVAVRFRMFGLAWDGRQEKSLTSDYTHDALLHYDVAFTYTYTKR